jgi:alpha-galactosidase
MKVALQPSSGAAKELELLFGDNPISSGIPIQVAISGQLVDLAPEFEVKATPTGATASLKNQGIDLNWQAIQLGTLPVWEFKLTATNTGSETKTLTRLDSASLALSGGPWRVESFASAWGDEFRPKRATTQHDSFFGVRSGRSSHGESPVVYFIRESDGFTVVVSPAWSGNWHIDVLAGGWISAGISTWSLNLDLARGETINAPSVIVVAAASKELAQENLQVAVRDHWLARSKASDAIPVEWNHWWPYEDAEISEEVVAENAELAKNMAIDTMVIDAGWFGESKLDTFWPDLRGDWSSVNLARFPSGLASLGETITKNGMQPGIWIELEAVGAKSQLRKTLPEAMARDDSGARPDPSYRVGTVSLDQQDPGFLGYVCLGSAEGWSHTYNSVKQVVGEMGARWLKMDFNIDPGQGCTRSDHGHRKGDGLLRHYEGLYKLLDQIRLDFPELIVEACSSGGLRIDLGLAKHVHAFFLSDPDYTEHHLQVLWGAAHMLPPLGILHWPWSWWRNGYEPSQLDWTKVEVETFDVMMRSAMFHRLGISYPLPKLAEKLRVRLAQHLEVFRKHIAPVLASATLHALTDSPDRISGGQRNPVWQLTSNTPEEVHFITSLKLESDALGAAFSPYLLEPAKEYVVTDLETYKSAEFLGKDITDTKLAELVGNTRSWLVEIRAKKVNL